MTHEQNELIQRIDRLELTNRRMKLWGGIACGACALLGLAGAAAVCDVVTGERLVLHDPSGRTRVTLDAYSSEAPSLVFHSREGRSLAKFGVSEEGDAWVSVYDKQGKVKSTYRLGAEAAPITPSAPKSEPKKDDAPVTSASVSIPPF